VDYVRQPGLGRELKYREGATAHQTQWLYVSRARWRHMQHNHHPCAVCFSGHTALPSEDLFLHLGFKCPQHSAEPLDGSIGNVEPKEPEPTENLEVVQPCVGSTRTSSWEHEMLDSIVLEEREELETSSCFSSLKHNLNRLISSSICHAGLQAENYNFLMLHHCTATQPCGAIPSAMTLICTNCFVQNCRAVGVQSNDACSYLQQ
jgi:hypothetical protein